MAAPNQPGPVTVVMGPGFEIEPQRAPGPMWLLESADRSRVGVVVASKTLRNVWVRSADQLTSVNQRKRKPNPLRNEAALIRVSLRSQLEHEVTWELSRVQMNVPYGTPLTAPHITTGGLCRWKAINKEGRHVGLDFYDLLIEGDCAPSKVVP